MERNKGNKISESLKQLLQSMLEASSEVRISMEDLMKHEWLSGEKETNYKEKMKQCIN